MFSPFETETDLVTTSLPFEMPYPFHPHLLLPTERSLWPALGAGVWLEW